MDRSMLDGMKLPQSNPNEELEDISNNLFVPLFDVTKVEVRKQPGRDKGIDFRMEMKHNDSITGFDFLIQLKATEGKEPNQDGSVSIQIYTSNINYLLNSGIPAYYVLYFKKENVFLYKNINDFVNSLRQKKEDWQSQDSHALNLTKELDASAIAEMYDHAIDNGLFLRKLKEKLALSESLVTERILVDPNLVVTSDSEIRNLIEKYGLFLINDSSWSEIIELHQKGSQSIASSAKYNLVVGIAFYYSGFLTKALDYFREAIKLKSELTTDLQEHLLLFDYTVRYALGFLTKVAYSEKINALGKSDYIRYYVKIEKAKSAYLNGKDQDEHARYEILVAEMNTILEADDANDNIKMLVNCEMVLFVGSKINMEYVRDYALTRFHESILGHRPDLRAEVGHTMLKNKMKWAQRAKDIKDLALQEKNYFVFFHVLMNETKVNYELEAYTELIAPETAGVLGDESKEMLNSYLANLESIIKYFKQISYVENVCAALSLKYEICHYMKDVPGAELALKELGETIETYDLRELHGKYEALKNQGTTHEKLIQFNLKQKAEADAKKEEYDLMVEEMKKLDLVDEQKKKTFEGMDELQLYPIGHFQFPTDLRQKAYDILNLSAEMQVAFSRMLDEFKVIPVANIFYNPITTEGYADGMTLNTSIEAWRNIFRIRKEFFASGFSRVKLIFPGMTG